MRPSGIVAFTPEGRFDTAAMTTLGATALFDPANPVPSWAAWARLPFQFLFIWLAWTVYRRESRTSTATATVAA